MTRQKTAIIIESGFATISTGVTTFTTTRLNPGQHVRVDCDQYPQLCVGAALRGPTIVYDTPEGLARSCRAKLYKTRKGFDAAIKNLEIPR